MNITPAPAVLPVDFYVYEHLRASTGEVFYVGKGQNGRAWFTANRRKHWVNIAKKHGVVVRIVQDGLQEWFAHELERDLIALHGRKDVGRGPLVNVTDGGEGTSGREFSAETLAKMSASKSGKRPHQNAFAALGRADVRVKMSAAKLGKPASVKAKAARFIAMNRPDVKAKLIAAQLGRVTPAQLTASGARAVRCIQSGEVFPSLGRAAASCCDLGRKTTAASISRSCDAPGVKKSGGFTWEWA